MSRSKIRKFLPEKKHPSTDNPERLSSSLTISSDLPSFDISEKILEHIVSQKGLDAIIYDLREKNGISDYVVVASGTSNRHVKGIVDKVKEGLIEKLNSSPDSIDGYNEGEWIVMDYGNVIAHIFYEPQRQYYLIDDLLSDAKKVPLREDLSDRVRTLKTGMHALG